jgi:RNA polymerase sigma-70 factor (ECF subfamily)
MRLCEELVRRVRGGDAEAFRELFAGAALAAYALALSQLGNPEDAREVVQEAALESFRKIACLREAARFPAWVCGMVRFLSYRRLRRPRALPLEAAPASALSEEPGAPAEAPGTVSRALLALPEGYRQALWLRHVEGKSYGEIARLLGISVAGVDSRLMRGRERLRRKLRSLEAVRP